MSKMTSSKELRVLIIEKDKKKVHICRTIKIYISLLYLIFNYYHIFLLKIFLLKIIIKNINKFAQYTGIISSLTVRLTCQFYFPTCDVIYMKVKFYENYDV